MSDDLPSLRTLLDVMARLRDPQKGCAWDLQQTFATIAPYTIEEAYEVADAIESNDRTRIRDELGDLLFQVVFHSQMAQELGWFKLDDVAAAISSKLIRRHPHVFGDARFGSNEELSKQWEDQKERERADAAGKRGVEGSWVLADVPRTLPALIRAVKLGKRAARVGFDWPDEAGVRHKVHEELHELDQALAEQRSRAETSPPAMGDMGGAGESSRPPAQGASTEPAPEVVEEFGDLLFSIVNLGRHLHVDPEAALKSANAKFERRFSRMEQLAGARHLDLKQLSAAEWDALWNEAKAAKA